MTISESMDLHQLAVRMGWESVAADIDWKSVRTLRELLVERYDGRDTSEIAANDWLALLDLAEEDG